MDGGFGYVVFSSYKKNQTMKKKTAISIYIEIAVLNINNK
jgi:hypothetical protein